MRKWLVFYTKSRQEKKVRDLLIRNAFEVFLPLQKVMRQWSDRKKKVEVPLFNSYIFVNDTEDRISEILQTPGVAWNIRHNDKPAVLHPREMEIIQRFLETGLFVETNVASAFQPGDPVTIMDGPLKGMSGTVIKALSDSTFSVVLDSIKQTLSIQIDPQLLKINPDGLPYNPVSLLMSKDFTH
ncbi:MAG: UpxY family transcription antiterminator [Cyclobacteriaceae bacterium]|nr:UpxY family transcription antiterminator [Cyclobacteriaceae bacterium]